MGLCATTMLVAGSAQATVALRVEARPAAPAGGPATPINVFATVTSVGNPVGGLNGSNFTVTVDGNVIASPTVTLPPAAGSSRVSVVFAMDYSPSVRQTAEAQMEAAVSSFISQMQNGDYAAIVKFNESRGATVVQPFTLIDGTNTALNNAVALDYNGSFSNLLDAIVLSSDQFVTPGVVLPGGPRAIVVVTDGAENSSDASLNDAIAAATASNISIFTIGVGNLNSTTAVALMTQLADQTSGDFLPAPTSTDIGNAYLQIESLLSNEYRLTFNSAISDCAIHTLSVRVNGGGLDETVTENFSRCPPLFAPDLTGKTRSEAITELTQATLVLGTESLADSATIPEGSVISQTPAANTQVVANSAVNLVISNGALRAVPDLANLTTAAATTALTNAGLVRGTITERNSATVPVGSVISHSPAAGTQVSNRSTVNLFVSSGPAPATPTSGGGGGGATGLLEILGGLGLLAFARRRQLKKN